jgi:hypothetical protein
MKTVLSKKDLKQCTEKFVMVTREDQMYMRVGDEYIRKMYWTTKEVVDMLNSNFNSVWRKMMAIGIKPRENGKRMKLTIRQVRQLLE